MSKKNTRKEKNKTKNDMQDRLFSNAFPNHFHNASAVSQTYHYDSLEDFDEMEHEDEFHDR